MAMAPPDGRAGSKAAETPSKATAAPTDLREVVTGRSNLRAAHKVPRLPDM